MTVPSFKENDFYDQHLRCPKCRWEGDGHDVVIIDFYGVSANKEAHCPNCDQTIAVVERGEGGPPGESASDLSFQFG